MRGLLSLFVASSDRSRACPARPRIIPLPPFRSVELRGGGDITDRPRRRAARDDHSRQHASSRASGCASRASWRSTRARRIARAITAFKSGSRARSVPDVAIAGGGRSAPPRLRPARRSFRPRSMAAARSMPRAVDAGEVSAAVNGGGQISVRARSYALRGGQRRRRNPLFRQSAGQQRDPRRRRGASRRLIGQLDDRGAFRAEPEPDRQQRPEGVVAAGAGMEGVEEQLRPAVEPRRDRGMARRGPFARRAQQRLAPAWCRARADDRRPRRRCRRTASRNHCRRRTASSGRPAA